MITIRKLDSFDEAEFRRLNAGYCSFEKYEVSKVENVDRTVLQVERLRLPEPYVRRWDTLDEDVERYRRVIAQGCSLAAYENEKMIAIGIAERVAWNRTMWVWEFHVDPAYQRQGTGRRLMDALADVARAAGMRLLCCETQNTNVIAIDFYRAVGFEMDAIDLSYYTNRDVVDGEVAIFMKRKLE